MQRVISLPVALLSLGQVILFISTAVLAILSGYDRPSTGLMLLLGAAAIWVTIHGSASGRAISLGWSTALVYWIYLLGTGRSHLPIRWDDLLIALLMLAGLLTSAWRITDPGPRRHWEAIGLAWGLVAATVWLIASYFAYHYHAFHHAIIALVILLIAARVLLRLPAVLIQVVHTLILLLVALPLVDAALRPSYELKPDPEFVKDFYSFEAAQRDPGAFSAWWNFFMEEWAQLHRDLAMKDPDRLARYKLKPNSETTVFDSLIRINSLGFRGPEIERDKGDAYRIIAIGESTTFGCTITDKGKPWPRLLEKMLNERLELDRPVQVINAGIYGLNIEENVRRVRKRLLDLDPDLIISYHGYNFFSSLNRSIPPVRGDGPPRYAGRPLKLLADFEYRLRLMHYEWSRASQARQAPDPLRDPMESRFAQAYKELIAVTREHDVQLALANFSMAVNGQSRSEVVEFYGAGFPEVRASIKANRAHSEIVDRIAGKHPDVIVVDTHPGLDGEHPLFIDLVHFTQQGRVHLAETFFHAISGQVLKDLKGAKAGEEPARTGDSEKIDQPEEA